MVVVDHVVRTNRHTFSREGAERSCQAIDGEDLNTGDHRTLGGVVVRNDHAAAAPLDETECQCKSTAHWPHSTIEGQFTDQRHTHEAVARNPT